MDILDSLKILVGVFAVLTLVTNLDTKMPRFPWDVLVDKFGFRLYIPIITSIFLSIIFSIIIKQLNTF